MRARKTEKLVLGQERLQTLTPAELAEVSGGGGPKHGHKQVMDSWARSWSSARSRTRAAPPPGSLIEEGAGRRSVVEFCRRPRMSRAAVRPAGGAVARRITGAADDRPGLALSRGGPALPRGPAPPRRPGWGQGRPAPVSPRWTARAYWMVLALVVAGLLGSAQLRVGEFARGPAVVRGQTVEAVVPAAFAAELRAGLPLELIVRGRAPVTAIVGSTGPELTGAGAASTLLGTDVTRAGLPPGTLLVVRATVPRRVTGGHRAAGNGRPAGRDGLGSGGLAAADRHARGGSGPGVRDRRWLGPFPTCRSWRWPTAPPHAWP